MGAPFMDYIVADRIVLPEEHRPFYDEKVVYLPHAYQPNDRKRAIAEQPITRKECGLPEHGIVFCCLNNTHKITPALFDIWMRLLSQIDGSVLWLLEANRWVADNVKREAQTRGVTADRIILAPILKAPEHLARLRLADFFLDTLPHNAHTTASDALWAGVPVVTCLGTTFAGRVAASLLTAAGLPDLVTHSLADYESVARQLASDPGMLRAAKDALARHRDSCALFDTARYTRLLESAYRSMWERHLRGEPPGSFHVEERV
jgi:predicted O-linked N-acetylglucosamine transferase (SPINDLY family)